MVMTASKLIVEVEARTQQAAAQLRQFGAQINMTGQQARNSASNLDAAGRSASNTGRQAAAAGQQVGSLGNVFGSANVKAAAMSAGMIGGAAGIAMIGSAAVTAGIQFEDAFAGVRKTVDATDAQLAMLESGIRDMATSMPMAATEIAGLAEAAGALGVKTSDIMEFTRVTALIGTTTDVASGQAATSLGQLSNVLNLTAEDYERFGSALVELGNNGASTESAILGITERAGASAQLIGFATEETLAWSSAVANLGIEVEAGGSSLQRFFIDAATMVSAAGEELNILAETAGMTADAFQQAFSQDSSAALQTFITGLGQLDQAQQLATLSALGFSDVRITRTLLGLAANTDNLTSSLASAEKGWRENTAMAEEAEKRFETTASKLQILKNQATDAAIEGFEILGPAIGEAAEMLGEFVVSIPPALEGMADFISTVQDMREADVSERTGLEGFLADIIELGSDANDVLNDLNAAINDLPTVVPLFDSKESNVSDVERNAEALLVAYEEVMGVSIVRTGDAVESLIAWETHTGTSFATVDDIYRRYIGSTKEVYDANQEMLAGLSSGIDGRGQTGLDNLSADLLALQSDWSDTARIIRDEQQALGNGFQEFSTSAETGFTQSTLSYSRFITAFSGNTDTALSSFDALTQSIATGAIDFEQAAALYSNIPRDQLVPAVTEAAAELRGKLADATLSEMDARAIEGQINALKVIFPDLVAEIDGTAEAIRNFGDVQDIFQGVVDVSRDRLGEWESNLSGAESALDILNRQMEDGIPLTKEQEEAYDTLTWATDRYAGGVEDSEQAVIDAEVAKADYIRTLDDLNQKLHDNEISQEDYNAAVGDALSKLDPAAGATYDLATAQGEVAGKLDEVIGRLRDLMVELGLIPVEHTIKLNLDTSGARAAFDAFMSTVYSSNPTAEAGVGFTQRAGGGTIPPGGEFALVGEEGPELMMLPGGAHIYPHDETMRMIRGFAGGTDGRPSAGGSSANIDIDMSGFFDVFQRITELGESSRMAWEQYVNAIVEDGDYLNDWLTHLPGEWQDVSQAIGGYIAAIIEDGDYLNDWVTHLPEEHREALIKMGKAWTEDFAEEVQRAREAVTQGYADLFSDLEGIVSGETGTKLGEELVELLSLQRVAEQMGNADLVAYYQEQIDAVNADLRRLGEAMGTPFVQGLIEASIAEMDAEQVAEEWDARLADALAGPQFGQNIQSAIDEMNEKIDLGILMGAPMDVIAGWQAERDQLVEEGATYWQDVVAAIAAGAFSPEEIAAFAEAGGAAFMDAMEETFSPEAIEKILGPVQESFDDLARLFTVGGDLYLFQDGVNGAKGVIDDLIATVADGSAEMGDLFDLMATVPGEDILPVLDQLEQAYRNQLVEAIANGNVEAEESILELMRVLGLLQDEFADTAAAANMLGLDAHGNPLPEGSNITQIAPGQWVSGSIANTATTVAPRPMATGGIVTQPLLALVGEAGREAVMPLEGPGAQEIADAIVSRMQAVPMNGGQEVAVFLDGEVIARKVAQQYMAGRYTRRGP